MSTTAATRVATEQNARVLNDLRQRTMSHRHALQTAAARIANSLELLEAGRLPGTVSDQTFGDIARTGAVYEAAVGHAMLTLYHSADADARHDLVADAIGNLDDTWVWFTAAE